MNDKETLLAHAGLDPFANHGVVNPPVYHASTIVFPTLAALEEADRTPYEGTRYGPAARDHLAPRKEWSRRWRGVIAASPYPRGLAPSPSSAGVFENRRSFLRSIHYGPVRRLLDGTSSRASGSRPPLTSDWRAARLIRRTPWLVYSESPGSSPSRCRTSPAPRAAARAAGLRLDPRQPLSPGSTLPFPARR